MRLAILTAGTRGDVEPCLALALGLQRAGYDVTVAADPSFASFVTSRSVPFAPLRADFFALFHSERGKAVMAGKLPRLLRGIAPEVLQMRQRMMEDAWAVLQDADAVIYHPRVLGAYDAAEKRGIPAVLADYLPGLVPTSRFPLPLCPRLGLGGLCNRLSYAAVHLAPLPFLRIRNRWRVRGLGLPPRPWFANDLRRNGRPLPVLYHFSRHVIDPSPEWRGRAEVTGFWFLDTPERWQPPAALAQFLAAGPPPVYVGFGSMVSHQAERVTAMVVEALRRCGLRGILMTGWGGLAKVPPSATLFPLESVPHGWLFPRVAAVVHHGGVGTTAAGLRAGKPTLVCPFFHDQPFWGGRVHELGVGPRPIGQGCLSVDGLAAAFGALAADEGMRHRAAELGEKIRAEDGVGRAVAWVEAFLAKHSKTRRAPGLRSLQAGGRLQHK
jgi:sterol 3beta-glucosyltransferase